MGIEAWLCFGMHQVDEIMLATGKCQIGDEVVVVAGTLQASQDRPTRFAFTESVTQ